MTAPVPTRCDLCARSAHLGAFRAGLPVLFWCEQVACEATATRILGRLDAHPWFAVHARGTRPEGSEGVLQVYGQSHPGDDLYVVGTEAALIALRDALGEVLDGKHPVCYRFTAGDGNPYPCAVVKDEALERDGAVLPPHYSGAHPPHTARTDAAWWAFYQRHRVDAAMTALRGPVEGE